MNPKRNMVKCPCCNGRGIVGYGVKGAKGTAFFDFECPLCKGRYRVSEERAKKWIMKNKQDGEE